MRTNKILTAILWLSIFIIATPVHKVNAYPYGGYGGWNGYRGNWGGCNYNGYRGGYYNGGNWGVPFAWGATAGLAAGLIGSAVAYNSYSPVYAAPVYVAPQPIYPPAPTIIEKKIVVKQTGYNSDILSKAQAKLAGLGYYKGNIDGEFGPSTTAAIQQFQADNSLPINGRLDMKTLNNLGLSL